MNVNGFSIPERAKLLTPILLKLSRARIDNKAETIEDLEEVQRMIEEALKKLKETSE